TSLGTNHRETGTRRSPRQLRSCHDRGPRDICGQNHSKERSGQETAMKMFIKKQIVGLVFGRSRSIAVPLPSDRYMNNRFTNIVGAMICCSPRAFPAEVAEPGR